MHAPLGVSGEPRIVRDHADRRAFAMEVAQEVHHRLAVFGVDLPQPDGPAMETYSPFLISR